MGVKTPPEIICNFLVSQLCLFVQQNMSSVWLVTACGITRNGKKYQTEIHAGMHKTHHFEIKNAKIFWGGDTPSPDLTPASIFAPTALKLNVTPPEKNPSYGLDRAAALRQLSFLF